MTCLQGRRLSCEGTDSLVRTINHALDQMLALKAKPFQGLEVTASSIDERRHKDAGQHDFAVLQLRVELRDDLAESPEVLASEICKDRGGNRIVVGPRLDHA